MAIVITVGVVLIAVSVVLFLSKSEAAITLSGPFLVGGVFMVCVGPSVQSHKTDFDMAMATKSCVAEVREIPGWADMSDADLLEAVRATTKKPAVHKNCFERLQQLSVSGS